ncbi:2-C-methyl-D-erythritol 4-phosphate cytidylyltransferase [Pseudidiomarina sp. PP-1MA]|uniref:2-C-methyl-D-erythritol 4-phosphate cytidylyltransferase n=1 Tax=Pseudidiomarina sp. PP-1MA TaxID=3237706 RepID=A0AB39X348_9GAMM
MIDHIPSIAAIVPAAGRGQRMASKIPKQYLQLAGKTVLEHSLHALTQDSRISKIYLALSAEDTFFSALQLQLPIPVIPVVGGASRAASVLAGVEQARLDGVAYVVVHDAARPCLQADELSKVIDVALIHPQGALLALPVADTMKRSDAHNAVRHSVKREHLWHALTPQVFALQPLLNALVSLGVDHPELTDEASAIELSGGKPQLVAGRRTNIKVTQPGDEQLADMYLKFFATERQG